MRIIVDLSGVDAPMQLAELARFYMEAVVHHNRYLLRLSKQSGLRIPSVLESGVVFRDEPWAGAGLAQIAGNPAPALEEFSHMGLVLQRGWGDCMQICGYRVAECRENLSRPRISDCRFCARGQPCDAGFRIYCRPLPTGRLFHVQTRHAPQPRFKDDPRAGWVEDTSRLLRVE